MKVNSICILGGGTAGWMTAASLVKNFPDKVITLVESEEVPRIGVGESTLQKIRYWLDDLGIKDSDFMKHCDATYKQSIKNYTKSTQLYKNICSKMISERRRPPPPP